MNLSNITPNTLISRPDNLLDCMIDDEVALMSIDNGEYYQLNPQASAIWAYIDTPKKFSVVIDALEREFEVERATCEADVIEFLNTMQQDNIIELN